MKDMIYGVPREKWLRAFADGVAIAIDKGYFSDTLFFYLYPDGGNDYGQLMKYTEDAFEEIFGIPLYTE